MHDKSGGRGKRKRIIKEKAYYERIKRRLRRKNTRKYTHTTEKEREKEREKEGKEGSKDRSFCTHVRTLS